MTVPTCPAVDPAGRFGCTLDRGHHGGHLALTPALHINAAWDETGAVRLTGQPDLGTPLTARRRRDLEDIAEREHDHQSVLDDANAHDRRPKPPRTTE